MTDNITERATDPRLEQTPVTEPVVDQVIEPVVDSDEPVDEVVAPVVEEPPKPPKKTAEEVLKGRVGHLTKTLSVIKIKPLRLKSKN
jgi:hypothetical protein